MSIIVNRNNHMNNNTTDSESALDEIEELIDWNLQCGMPLHDTLAGIQRTDLHNYFQSWFTTCYGKPC